MASTEETRNKRRKLSLYWPVQSQFPTIQRVWVFRGQKDEVDLILSQAAMFAQPANISSVTICPLHRAKLGLGWTKGSNTRCRVPEVLSNHGKGGKTWPKSDREIGKGDSQIILEKTGVFLQVGSGKLTFADFVFFA